MQRQVTMNTLLALHRMNKLITEDQELREGFPGNLNKFVEDKNSFKLRLNLAGAAKESIKVSFLDNMLTVLAKAEDDIDYHYKCHVPSDKVDAKKAKSKYEDGILSVIIPKQAAARSVSIKVD